MSRSVINRIATVLFALWLLFGCLLMVAVEAPLGSKVLIMFWTLLFPILGTAVWLFVLFGDE